MRDPYNIYSWEIANEGDVPQGQVCSCSKRQRRLVMVHAPRMAVLMSLIQEASDFKTSLNFRGFKKGIWQGGCSVPGYVGSE